MKGISLCDQRKEEALLLLKTIIEYKTVNPPGDEKPLAAFIADYLKDTVDNIFIDDIDNNRSNVIAVIKGSGNKKSLVLNGHIDTVPYGDLKAWHYPPGEATIEGSRLYGRGASDMKSGLTALLYAFKLFSCYNKKPEGDIIFIATADEESYGLGAQQVLKGGFLKNAGAIIIGEPTNNSIALASKGAIWVKFEVFGRSSHGAYPQEGINAIEISYELVASLRKLLCGFSHKHLTVPTCTITGINGGIKANIVPDHCEITVDIRTVPAVDHGHLFFCIGNIIEEMKEKYNGLEVITKILNNRVAAETSEQDPTVQMLADIVEEVTDSIPQYSGTGYFSDASIFQMEKNIPTILFGPGLASNAHKADEYVDIECFYIALQCYIKLISKY